MLENLTNMHTVIDKNKFAITTYYNHIYNVHIEVVTLL